MLKKKTNELSASIEQDFRPDLITQCGFTGTLTALAYDPVQSLFAAGTDTGMVHVMGAGEIRCLLDPNPKHKTPSAPIRHLRFVTSVYLVSIDDRSCVVVWALDSRSEWARYQSPFSVLSCFVDPSMDWLFLGHHNGEVTVFDIDRGRPTPYKIANLERIVDPKLANGAALNLQMHPRDPSALLICYREVAVVWNIVKGEIIFDLHYEFPLTYAVWHPSGSHIATAHVNGFVVFWDGQKGVRLGARNAFPTRVEEMDLKLDKIPEGMAWCCKEDPTDTFLLAWGGRTLSMVEFGPTPVVATSSYDYMGNFYKNPQAFQRELSLNTEITLSQLIPQAGNPHFEGCYNPSHIVLAVGQQLICVNLPALHVSTVESAVLPPALCWRSCPITHLSSTSITRNQWIGMMAAAQPNTKVTGGNSATQQIRKLQLATIICMGCSNGSIKLFDATRADSRDYRVLMTSVAQLDPERPVEMVTKISMGREVGEMSVATASGNIFMLTFGKNRRLMEPGPPAPQPDILNVEHLTDPEINQGFIPQWLYRSNVPVTTLCNSSIGFVAVGYENGRVVLIDKRGPAVIMDETIKGTATTIEFGIVAMGSDAFSSILLAVGTTLGDILVYRVIPRPQGGYQVLTDHKSVMSLSLGKDPVNQIAFVDTREGRSALATPDVMARLASGITVQGAVLGISYQDAKFFALTGAKPGKKLGSKNFDTPLLGASYAYLRWGTSSAMVTINLKGKCGIYGLPSLSTMSTYQIPTVPEGTRIAISEMGDAFIPYDRDANAGQIIRIFGTDQFPKPDDVWQLKRRVPARPTISTVHWMAGKQYVKPSDLDVVIAGKRRGKSKRSRGQLVDESGYVEPVSKEKQQQEQQQGSRGWFGNKPVPTFSHPRPQRGGPQQKTWGQTFNKYYETAEDTVNEALDEAMDSMNSGRKQAQSSAMKGFFGF